MKKILNKEEVFNLLKKEIFKVDTGIDGSQIEDFMARYDGYVDSIAEDGIEDIDFIVAIINDEN